MIPFKRLELTTKFLTMCYEEGATYTEVDDTIQCIQRAIDSAREDVEYETLDNWFYRRKLRSADNVPIKEYHVVTVEDFKKDLGL